MDKKLIKSTIEGLRSSSSNKVFENLTKIRNKIIITESGIKSFRENGGLIHLSAHLRKTNETLLDLALSVLGNCCLERESSLSVGKLNVFGTLLSIVKNVSRDSIVGRACRLIGNLAKERCNAEKLHNHGAVDILLKLIQGRDKNTSNATLVMAVRAIRQLWMVTEKRDEMINMNTVFCVSMLMTGECESAKIIKTTNNTGDYEGLRKSKDELLTAILKCVVCFTSYASSQCVEQIQGDGRGFQCLVALTKTHESLALKCLMNLCYQSSCRPMLGTAGFIECLVKFLQTYTEVHWWPSGAARALAQLSGEAVNRARLRRCGGLTLLLAAARTNPHAMQALLQYIFDDISFQMLLNEGLVSFLVEELKKYVSNMPYNHDYVENMDIIEECLVEDIKTEKLDSEAINPGNEKSGYSNDFKVVIERDNMIVGFVDALDSDASDDSLNEDITLKSRRKKLKRARSESPKSEKKKKSLIKMSKKDWSVGVYWEPKSTDTPWTNHCSFNSIEKSTCEPLSPDSEGNESGFSPEYKSCSSNKYAKMDWSPESGYSAGEGCSSSPHWNEYQWSPSSSGSLRSPLSTGYESSGSEMSGRYSPVCSEPEDVEQGTEKFVSPSDEAELEAAQMAHDLDELMMDDDDCMEDIIPTEDKLKKIDTNMATSQIACIMVLLFRVSHGNNPQRDKIPASSKMSHCLLLTGKECLNALLDYVAKCNRPLGRAARILAKILSNPLCLMSILKHRLLLRLYDMSINPKHHTTKCRQCKQVTRFSTKLLNQLALLAESSYGIGEISHQLLTGNNAIKQTLSVTLPYIVKTEKPLRKYLVDCKALDILFSIIYKCKEELQLCVTALSKLACNLRVKDPKMLETRYKDRVCFSYDPILDNLSIEEIVTFLLDNQETVRANKVFLCQNSDVFNAMFRGCFKESIEKCVKLQKVSKAGLEYLLTLLHCGLNSPKCEIQIFPMAESLETNLEALLLTDRYLFDNLKALLSSAILQFQLKPNTADKIYVWSLNEGMGFLCVESVAYLLTGKMCDLERVKGFKAILDLEYKEQWLDDIKTMLLRQLVK